MKKPTLKREVAIDAIMPITRVIHFYSTADALSDFEPFGTIMPLSGLYSLKVDSRYDFDEVVAYIEAYG